MGMRQSDINRVSVEDIQKIKNEFPIEGKIVELRFIKKMTWKEIVKESYYCKKTCQRKCNEVLKRFGL